MSTTKLFAKNTSWLIFDKIIRLGMGLVVGVMLARYLGPAKLGVISYAFALVSFWNALAGLGLEEVVVKQLITRPGEHGEIMGTAVALCTAAGIISFVGCIGISMFTQGTHGVSFIVVVIIGTMLLLKGTHIVEMFFQSKLLSKYAFIALNIGAFTATGAKLAAMLLKSSLPVVAAAYSVEAITVSAILLIMYIKVRGVPRDWRVTYCCAKRLLLESWPLALSSIMIIVYMRIDQVMLQHMGGSDVVGIYSAAAKVAEIWYFLPTAFAASAYPLLIDAKSKNIETFNKLIDVFFFILTWIGIVFGTAIALCSRFIVALLYGSAYISSAPVLAVLCWSGVFVAQGVGRGKWLLAMNLQRFYVWHIGIGCCLNVALNLILIPKQGAVGAAVASIIAQFAVALLAPALFAETRRSAILLVKSFFLNVNTLRSIREYAGRLYDH